MQVMQSAAKHLACIATQNRRNDWITITREMLRCALHDSFYLGTNLVTMEETRGRNLAFARIT